MAYVLFHSFAGTFLIDLFCLYDIVHSDPTRSLMSISLHFEGTGDSRYLWNNLLTTIAFRLACCGDHFSSCERSISV